MSDDQDEWVNVSSCTGLPGLSQTKAVKWVCVRACVRVHVYALLKTLGLHCCSEWLEQLPNRISSGLAIGW